jgi:chaperonin cofactor prefoldin
MKKEEIDNQIKKLENKIRNCKIKYKNLSQEIYGHEHSLKILKQKKNNSTGVN